MGTSGSALAARADLDIGPPPKLAPTCSAGQPIEDADCAELRRVIEKGRHLFQGRSVLGG